MLASFCSLHSFVFLGFFDTSKSEIEELRSETVSKAA